MKLKFRHATAVMFLAVSLLVSSCTSGLSSSSDLLQDLTKYCTARGQASLDKTQSYSRVESFFSPTLKTCVQIQVQSADKNWDYAVVDVTYGFLNAPKLIKSPYPLTVSHFEHGQYAHASAEGYWKEMDESPDKKLLGNVAVSLSCDREEHHCTESQALVFGGLVEPSLVEYTVSSWTATGIVAETDGDGGLTRCPMGHRLTVDFKSNTVVVVDYAKIPDTQKCAAESSPSSYTLQGGTMGIMGDDFIFSCSKDGINNAVTSKVEALNGDVIQHPYTDFLDDGSGGPAATIKTPAHPFTQADCEKALDKKLKELRGE